jgi:hypothetical protein
MGRPHFFSVETANGTGWSTGRTFRTLTAARRWAKRWAPARIIRHQGAERVEVN